MKVFSLQQPFTRNYLGEWIWQKAVKQEGLIGLRHEYVQLSMNGEKWGVVNLEEHFDKRLLENNERREGPILKFGEALYWNAERDLARGAFQRDEELYNHLHKRASIRPYGYDLENMTEDQLALVEKAVWTLDEWRKGNRKTGETFDVQKLATFYALMRLLSAEHGAGFINMRFYYNPVTTLLEPIAFDGNAGGRTPSILTELGTYKKGTPFYGTQTNYSWLQILMADPEFVQALVRELERVSKPNYVKGFLDSLEPALSNNLRALHSAPNLYSYSGDDYFANARTIQAHLNPKLGLEAYLEKFTENKVELSIGNLTPFPIEVIGFSIKGRELIHPVENKTTIESPGMSNPTDTQTVQFRTQVSLEKETLEQDLVVHYRILGSSRTLEDGINKSPNPATLAFDNQLPLNADSSLSELPFLSINEEAKTIFFLPGDWVVDSSLVIPKGYTVLCGSNTTIDLTNGATIVSHSPIRFEGEREAPIYVVSTDGSGGGFAVMQAEEASTMSHVIFNNLANPSAYGWSLTGAVTFYESDVSITDCEFRNNRSEDGLNLIRSPFSIEQSLFVGTQSDALDVDFSGGSVASTDFLQSGNDAIDVSGSAVTIDSVVIRGVGDKGVSAGENSQLSGSNITVYDAELGVASKDLSIVEFNKLTLENCRVGFTAYQKKPEFGPASIEVAELSSSDVEEPFLIEQGSLLNMNGRSVTANREDVKELMYGNQYGKSSK